MIISKQLTNTTALKVAFVPQTNHNGNRYKITQLNNGKSVFIDGNLNIRIEPFIASVLDKIEVVKSYSLCVDNTQSKYYLFNIDFKGDSFENILGNFKF
jgi:hypothetical protein